MWVYVEVGLTGVLRGVGVGVRVELVILELGWRQRQSDRVNAEADTEVTHRHIIMKIFMLKMFCVMFS